MQEAQKQQQRFLASVQLLAVPVEQPQESLPLSACLDSGFSEEALVQSLDALYRRLLHRSGGLFQ